ncbi:hypothetical protein GALMADRAFT_141040 [Galerina marginata CBS 339.88]|uniref:PGG domain-containing protein n=1 Tax=Galerina marginata (strain CBS 339.88) TaxID=685588 RepID=A0A067SUW5_GALM3|nr:hypothetical protein GALMADRAFT_141040 [Galerina marginata CBS 339.88]
MASITNEHCQHPTQIDPQMPKNWNAPTGLGVSMLFKLLCIGSFGRSTLQRLWDVIQVKGEGKVDEWKEEREALVSRTTNMGVVTGLLLATIAVLCSTIPPVTSVYDWTRPLPYVCLVISGTMALLSLIAGGVVSFMATAVQRDYLLEILTSRKSRLRIICFLILLAYPFVMLALATLTLGLGLASAAWLTGNKLVIIIVAFLSLTSFLVVAPFLVLVMGNNKKGGGKSN